MSSVLSPLAPWGLDEQLVTEYDLAPGQSSLVGRVIRADTSSCSVITENGETRAGLGPKLKETPTTGDWILLNTDSDAGERHVTAVLPRRTVITRASFRTLEEHVLAANVDQVMVVASLATGLRPRRIERLLVIAWQTGAVPSLVLTKSDLADDPTMALRTAASVAPGVSVHVVSALTGEGMAELEGELHAGVTAVMLGPSGTGKSTLANTLTDGLANLTTQDVRSDTKGRHTTVSRELVMLRNGGLLIDTPGLRAVGLVEDADALAEAFADIEELAMSCRFSDCRHASEPGCEVLEAVAEGALSQERVDSYERLRRDQLRIAARNDARLRAERTAEWRRYSREQKRQFRR